MSITSLVATRGHADTIFAQGRALYTALCTPAAALTYRVGEELAAQFPDRAIIESDDYDFDAESFAAVGLCELQRHEAHVSQQRLGWDASTEAIMRHYQTGWFRIRWQSAEFELVRLTIPTSCGEQTVRWLLAPTPELAEGFFSAVCAWSNTVDETIMVFQDGYWQKNDALYQSIKRATLENLVLGGTLKEDLYRDLSSFFAARAVYERANIPWKRGIVLIGPPGNGKTHAVKALINALDKPCLYVKSLSSQHADDHHNIRLVFNEARETAPCILVLEDLDSLITDHNRSFFLNELDGFASNEGVVTIASTNHPEKLDPAIMARPSRFDRKYHFALPASGERHAYLALWAAGLEAAMCPAPATLASIAADTDGFSFAYMKELLIAATVRWAEHQEPGSMDLIMPAELASLRTQMNSAGLATS